MAADKKKTLFFAKNFCLFRIKPSPGAWLLGEILHRFPDFRLTEAFPVQGFLVMVEDLAGLSRTVASYVQPIQQTGDTIVGGIVTQSTTQQLGSLLVTLILGQEAGESQAGFQVKLFHFILKQCPGIDAETTRQKGPLPEAESG